MSERSAPAALRWTGYIAVAVLFAIACGFLSHWQFSRNEERSSQLALVDANYDAEPVSLAEALAPEGELEASKEWSPVRLTGSYLADDQLLVRNRAHGGTSAFEVLVPFRTDDGRVLIVDRGWVPPGDPEPVPDSVPAPPSGEATVIVRLRPSEMSPASGRTAEAGQVPTVHLPTIADTLPSRAPIETGAYGMLVSEQPSPAVAPNPLPSPTEDPGPHLSYAIQWILFAIMGFGFIGYIIVSERRIRREEAAESSGAALSPRPARRRDRDADAEDALLNAR